MESVILGLVTKKEMDTAIASLRKDAALIKKITDARVIDREKVRQLFPLVKNVHSSWTKILHIVSHWDDVLEELEECEDIS